MGAWGPGNFENDGALDWLGEFLEVDDDGAIDSALRAVVDAGEQYVDVDQASAALAAAEAVAALNGHAAAKLPKELVPHLGSLGLQPSSERTSLAISAVERVQGNSELKELWEEGGPNEEWHSVLRELLLTRLAARPRPIAKRGSKKRRAKPTSDVREVATLPSPDGAWVFSVVEIDSPAGAHTQAALSHAGGGSGVWAAMGTNLGISARWLDARQLEVDVPGDAKELQRQARIQHFSDVVIVTYRQM